MEISTHDLFEVTIQENKLQNNFIIIEKMLKNIQQRVGSLQQNIKLSFTQIDENKHQVDNNSKNISHHETRLNKHQHHIQKLYQQIAFISEPDAECFQMDNDLSHGQEQLVSNVLGQNGRPSLKEGKREDYIETSVKKQEKELKKPAQKSKFEKIIQTFKEKIKTLQNKELQTAKVLQQIQRQISQHQNIESALKVDKIQRIQEKLPKRASNILQLYQPQDKNRANYLNYESIATQSPLQGEPDEQQKMLKVEKDAQRMKEQFFERIRLLELHLKQNQNKTHHIQKNMDLIQRSHEILKYDFQRTSTSFSKNRNQTTEEHSRKHDSLLNDTRITNRSYYEDKLIELFHQMQNLKAQYIGLADKIDKDQSRDQLTNQQVSNSSSNSKIGSKIVNSLHRPTESQLLKKQLGSCKRDLKKLTSEFQEFAYGVNIGTNEIKTILIKPNENKEDWKTLSTKMFRLKMQLQSNVKELEGKIITNNDMAVILNQLETGIQECKLLIKKKVEIIDFEKTIKRVESRLSNFILQVFEKQGMENQADASIVKQPWFCLSCDNEFKNYSGKVSKNTPIQKLTGKKVNPENHMVRRNDYSRLPSVLK